jgi:TPR repeat protein/tRNA A-37 threonylcarbamoyl transferase component Bud32
MPRSGDTLSERYEVVEVLAVGGSSVVYRARDTLVGGQLAVKVLSPRKSRDPGFAERFRREGRLLRELTHPNTVKIADVGQTPGGCLYLVQELIVGDHLGVVIARDGPFPPSRVVRVTSQVLRALSEAHRLGVVHRDLKPENIMICDFPGETDVVKLVDFGTAQPGNQDPEAVSLEGATRDLMLTPRYAAPELLRGEEAQPESDIFSLGLVCLEMLTGRPAVTGPTVWRLILGQVSDDPVAMPEEVSGHAIGRVIRKATAKRLEERYESAQAMLEALLESACGIGFPLVATPPRAEPVAVVTPRPAPRRGLALALLALLLIGGGLWLAGRARWWTAEQPGHRGPGERVTSSAGSGDTPRPAQRCLAGDYDLCLALALGAGEASDAALSPKDAVALLDVACLRGERAQACLELARRHSVGGASGQVDPERAALYLERACQAGDVGACLQAGHDHLRGDGRPPDLARARRLLEAACRGGEAAGCAAAAPLYANGLGVERDPTRAAELYAEACRGEVLEACTRLGVLYLEGRGVTADPQRSRALFERSCRAGDQSACANLAMLYHRGLGVDVDGERARAHYEPACRAGVAVACAGLGALYEAGLGVEADLERAAELYRTACEADQAVACFNLARLIERGELDGTAETASTYLDRACEGGYQPACRLRRR